MSKGPKDWGKSSTRLGHEQPKIETRSSPSAIRFGKKQLRVATKEAQVLDWSSSGFGLEQPKIERLGPEQPKFGTGTAQDWDRSSLRLGSEHPKSRVGAPQDSDRSGPRLGHEGTKIWNGAAQDCDSSGAKFGSAGAAQDWERSGPRLRNDRRTPRLGPKRTKIVTASA